MKTYTHEERCNLIARVASWCFDSTESWEPDNIGTGLAYLFWAIASPSTVVPFDATLANAGGWYDELVRVLELNPNGLRKDLIDGGFILVDPKIKRRVMKSKGKK